MELFGRCFWMLAFLDVCRTRAPDNRLLVVSFDGFRNDYFNRSLTPHLNELIKQSAFSERVVNVFPTQTFPNHFSIATGRYVEDHGVLASEIMDPKTHETLKYGYKLFHFNDGITPIWTLNELKKDGRHSGCMMWPGCNMAYRGTNVTYSVDFNVSVPWEDRIAKTLAWFNDPKRPVNLAMLYFESPDQESHIYGPDSPETNAQINKADKAVDTLLQVLKSNNLTDVNLILLSDHGMESVTLPRIINLTGIIKGKGKEFGTSPILQIYPNEGEAESLYKQLLEFSKTNGHFNVYKKRDIPEAYHYKNCDRAPPILAVAKPKYGFHDLYHWIDYSVKYKNMTVTNLTEFGVHGYDPLLPSMQPFLIANGPKFDKGLKIEPALRMVDLYGIFTAVLGLEVPDEGPFLTKLSRKGMQLVHNPLNAKEDANDAIKLTLFALASLIGLSTLLIGFILFQRRQNMRNLGYTLVDKDESGV